MMRTAATISVLTAAVVTLTSCGANHSTPGDPSTKVTDPALRAAAAAVQPMLEQSFPDTFAGLEIRQDVPALIVYRKPDPPLDAKVSRAAPEVRVEFRDARYSLTEMTAAGDRLMDDRDYWKTRGTTVVAVGPAVDGSGVRVTTSNAADGFTEALRNHYPAMSFDVRQGNDVVPPIYTRSMPPLTGPLPTHTKEIWTHPVPPHTE
ncbi:hypothetical protein [Actinophytocola gossypii]|uniref:Lipoprotein n=1 Tax=Actinophytocola gossypii TaxID=2812003 RepID=A0ABT2JKE3_9PSEU|nr:hypothetical protein [Actinophytocola gossypii]MCT2587769.1 hypothetical protein [Actinophytocola gossypii]